MCLLNDNTVCASHCKIISSMASDKVPWLQTAAQTDRQHALAKLTELEGVLQQALDQRSQAAVEASNAQNQLRTEHAELLSAQQQLQQQQQEIAVLQVMTAHQPYMQCIAG